MVVSYPLRMAYSIYVPSKWTEGTTAHAPKDPVTRHNKTARQINTSPLTWFNYHKTSLKFKPVQPGTN